MHGCICIFFMKTTAYMHICLVIARFDREQLFLCLNLAYKCTYGLALLRLVVCLHVHLFHMLPPPPQLP